MAQYAIIEESGGQRKVEQGESILIDLVENGKAKPGTSIKVDRVLVVGEPGGEAKLGTPYVAGASVTLEVTEPEVMGDKLYIYKFKPKKGFDKKTGHRQRYTGAVVKAIKG
jgi:large subunit ribosomal protein L21